jgi:hypothetical protein
MSAEAWNSVRTLGVLGLLGVAALIALGSIDTKDFVPVAVVLLAALALAALSPSVVKNLWQRDIGFKGPGIEVTISAAKPPEPHPVDEDKPKATESIVELQLRLQAKLAYIAKHMLRPDSLPDFLSVGSLWFDRLLSPDDAELAQRLLSVTDETVASWSSDDRESFLAEANRLVARVRWNVLDCQMRKVVAGWCTYDLERGGNRRPDVLVDRGDRRYWLRSVFLEDRPGHPRLMESVDDMLRRRPERWANERVQIIVVQNNVGEDRISGVEPPPAGVNVVRVDDLAATLEG